MTTPSVTQTDLGNVLKPDGLSDLLREIAELYHRGLYLQAYQKGQLLGPLKDWRGTDARLLASRLATQLGGHRLGRNLQFFAWRADRQHPAAAYYYARMLHEHAHPLTTWRFLDSRPDLTDAPPPVRADWLSFRAFVLGRVRDFEAADALVEQAARICPERPWLCVEHSYLLEMEDRYAEALAAAQRALSIRPWYRPGVQTAAHLLQLLDRDREAQELLIEATRHIECASVYAQLARLQIESGQFEDARRNLEQFIAYSPLIEEFESCWAHSHLSDTWYYRNDFAKAAEFARKAERNPYYAKIADRLETLAKQTPAEAAASGHKRVMLPVGFVRQHHVTCAPATLSAISRFWSQPAEHLELAEEICYDGTPAHSERNWAERHGWIAREFTVTWESARTLIDLGVPFTLTTTEVTSGHLQAVIGYDSFRGTMLIRDPFERHFREFTIEGLLERYKSVGPRGMAMVPGDRSALLDGLKLQDEDLYNDLHVLNAALSQHDRTAAWKSYEAMAARDSGHRLTLQGRRSLAAYDGDQTTLLACTESLLKLFPGDPRLFMSKLFSLRHLARREERLKLLEDLCDFRKFREQDPDALKEARRKFDPIVWQTYAQELSADARNNPKTIELLRKCIRYSPQDAGSYSLLADVFWDSRNFDNALALYRIAACIADREQRHARSYFIALRHFKKHDTAISMMENRFRRFASQSGDIAQCLHWALDQLNRQPRAREVLDSALNLRPDDGSLLLYAAENAVRFGEFERAKDLLKRAEGKSQRSRWLQASAHLARSQGDLKLALALWRQVIEVEPLSVDANRAYTRLLAETESRAAALEHLRTACDKFPFNFQLHQLQVEWLRNDDPVGSERVLRHLIEIDSSDAWVYRELAMALRKQGRLDEAFTAAETGRQLDPEKPFSYCVLGKLHHVKHDLPKAVEAFRHAIRLSVDNEYAIKELMECCETPGERREALAFIHDELVRQVIFGDGLLAYRERAHHTLESDALLKSLQQALDARPDLWHAWSAVIQQLVEMKRLDEAHALAMQATERFPLVARLWLAMSDVCRTRQDSAGRIAALEKALQISPEFSYAARQLASAYEDSGDLEKARIFLEQAISRAPLDGFNHGCLANVLWKQGFKPAALQWLTHALRLEHDYPWGWRALHEWTRELKCHERALEVAREITLRRGGEAKSWITLARIATGKSELTERLAALEKAITVEPHCVEAYDLRAAILAQEKRYEEGLALCGAPPGMAQTPLILRGRAAWIEAERGNLDLAFKLIRETLADDPNYYWGWELLCEWAERKKDFDTCVEAAKNLVRIAPHVASSHGYMGHVNEVRGNMVEAKEDFRRALSLEPDDSYASRKLFDLCFDGGDLDGAEFAVRQLSKHHGEDAYSLTRWIRLLAKRGDNPAALDRFRQLCALKPDLSFPLEMSFSALKSGGFKKEALEVLNDALKKDADNYWGWKQLADLDEDAKDKQAYHTAASHMARLKPNHPIAFGYLGFAKAELKDRRGAIEAFQKALTLAPDYSYAARWLFDLQFASKQYAEAEKTLNALRTQGVDQYLLTREIALVLERDPIATAEEPFRQLCMLKDAEEWAFKRATANYQTHRKIESRNMVVNACLSTPGCNPRVAELWFESRTLHFGGLTCGNRLRTIADRGVQRNFVVAWLRKLAEIPSNDLYRLTIRRTIHKHADLLKEDTFAWGSAGYTLNAVRYHRHTVEWLSGWKERKDIKPWILLSLSVALRFTKQPHAAHETSEAALQLPADHTRDNHLLWLAHDDLIAGRIENGAQRIAGIQSTSLSAYYQFMFAGVDALLKLAQANPDRRTQMFDVFAASLRRACQKHFPGNTRRFWGSSILRRAYRDWLECAARLNGGRFARLWATWRKFVTY